MKLCCKHCKQLKSFPALFVKVLNKTYNKYYTCSTCKACKAEASRTWYNNNQEHVKAYRKKYYKNHKEYFRRKNKEVANADKKGT